MSERVPEGWENRQFGQFCREKSVKFDGKSELPVLSVTKYDGFVSSLDYFNKQVFSRDLSSYKVVRKGQFAYATIHLDEGSLGLLSDYDGGLISPMYTVFETTEECNSKFLFFLMKSDLYMTKYPALGQGSINRRMSISFRSLSELNIATPPLPEQKKIASILTSVDEVIENTQKQIDKLQDLKKATMNELLTKGIGHTEFKDSELGRIPKSWDVVELRENLTFISYGFTNPMPESKSGNLMVTAKDVNNGVIDYENARKTTSEAFEELLTDKSRPKIGDVLLTKDGTLGRLAVVDKKGICINQSVAVLRPNEKISSMFLFNMLSSPYYQKTMLDNAGGSTIKHIYITVVDKMKVVKPPLDEQDAITTVLSKINVQFDIVCRKLVQTQSLKKSLMQDLLTGRVRVQVN